MRYKTVKSFRRALEDRLWTLWKKEGIDLARLQKRVGFERLLARLFDGEKVPWLLKATFGRRATHPVPQEIAAPPAAWQSMFHQLAVDLKLRQKTVEMAHTYLAHFWKLAPFPSRIS